MPGGTTITYLPLLVQRNKALWGPDADKFDPERWLQPDRLARYVANPTMFTPFSAGPRIVSLYVPFSIQLYIDYSGEKKCLGQNYAYHEVSYLLVRLLQKFERFTLAPEVQPQGSLPPPEWKKGKGRQAEERIWPSAAMTLYVKV